MKVLFYGAGVLGSLYAARLHGAGHEVSILARGQRLADLRAHGIVLEEADTGRRTTTHVHIVEQLAPDDAYPLVVVLMSKHQALAILPVLAANRYTPNVLFMGNNLTGPDELVEALGRERVLLCFPGAAGHRSGHVVRFKILSRFQQPTTVGELDGRTTPRLRHIVEVFKSAGFPVASSSNMDAWLKTHVAEICPTAEALSMAGGDTERLARNREGQVLMVRAIREGYRVLRALGVPITPASHRMFDWIPERMLVALVRRILGAPTARRVTGHADAASEEIQRLASEFKALVRRTPVPTPAMDRLATAGAH